MQFGIFDWVEASDSLSPAEVYEHKLQLAAAAISRTLLDG